MLAIFSTGKIFGFISTNFNCFGRRLSQPTTSAIAASEVKDADTSQNVPTVRPISAVHEYAYIPEDEGNEMRYNFIF